MARSIRVVGPRLRLSQDAVAKLYTCKFQPKLKAGMSNSEATDAIDTALKKWIQCLTGYRNP